MKSLSIDNLLKDLESDAHIEKSASAKETAKPAISAELSGILEKKASEDLTKQAFEQGEALARELLAKVANEIIQGDAQMVADDDKKVTANDTGGTVENVLQSTVDKAVSSGATTEDRVNHETQVNNVDPGGAPVEGEKQAKEDTSMNKSAQEDKSLAKLIMEKLAQEFSSEVTTDAAAVNVEAAPAPNMIQRDNAAMTAQDDGKVEGVVPGGDGTVNALFETIVNNAKSQGGQSYDLINGEGHVEQRLDGQPGTDVGDSVEKAAAVSALCSEGLDFDTAVSLVKQAEEAIFEEAWEQEKQACLKLLMNEGIDFNTAVELTKQAEQTLLSQKQ